MAEPSTTPEQQRIARYKHDPKFARELDARFAHQHKQSESELSGGSHANAVGESRTKEEKRISAANSSSNPNSFFNSYWFVVVTILVFFGCILLTNLVLGL